MNFIQAPILRRYLRAGCWLLLGLFMLSGCGQVREHSAQRPANWEHLVAQRTAITDWYVQGQLGVQTEHNGGSLDLFWNQQGERYRIRMIAPFGRGAYLVTGDIGQIRVTGADGETVVGDDADALFEASLGVRLPLHSLRYWLRGLPGASASDLRWDGAGDLHLLREAGWKVELARYRDIAGQRLPHAFYLSREDSPELRVQLLLRSWQLTDLKSF